MEWMTMAEGDIRIPVIGEVPKKYAIGGVVVGVGVVGAVMLRNRKASNSANTVNASGDTMVTDPAGNTCVAVDPGSGYCPGTEGDLAYQDSLANGGVGVDPFGGNAGFGSGTAVDGIISQGPATNDEWIQQALTDVPGNPETVQAALAAVLGGLTVTTAQRNIFLEAVGINGQPPGGYPQPIKTSDTSGHPGSPGKDKVPNVKGKPQEEAFAILQAAGFKPKGSPVIHGKTLIVRSQHPAAGAMEVKGSVVSLTSTANPVHRQ